MFSSDSKSFLYEDQHGIMHRINLQTHKSETVLNMNVLPRPLMPYWPSWSGLAPDGSILAMHNIGTQEIYALDWQP